MKMAKVIIEYEEYQRLLKIEEEKTSILKEVLTEVVISKGPFIIPKLKVKVEIMNNQLTITKI